MKGDTVREFAIVQERRPDVRIVSIQGELDLSRAEEARSVLEQTGSGHEPALVIDLTACDFIDSMGVSAIVAASRSARAAGVTITVASTRGSHARRILDLTGVSRALASFDGVDEAVGAALTAD